MKLTCIDIGNTHTHYGSWEAGSITETGNIKTQAWFKHPEQMSMLLNQLNTQHLAYCSVVPQVCTTLDDVTRSNDITTYHLTCEDAPGLPIHYPTPHEIGQDRLANAIFAQAFHGSPSIVIDMGTAVTFDIVGNDGAYEGGIIAPGIAAMTRYLHEQTALLPELDENDLLVQGGIGKSTKDAMKLGCVVGFSGMIAALLKRVLQALEAPEDIPVIGTGGTATSLLKDIHPHLTVDNNATLRGLGEAWRRKQEK